MVLKPESAKANRFRARLIATPVHAPTHHEVIDRLRATLREGDPLCMVSSDPAYLQALRPILKDPPSRFGVIATGQVKSMLTGNLLAQDVLAGDKPINPKHFGLTFLEIADLHLQPQKDRHALQDRVRNWIQDEVTNQTLETRLDVPADFCFCRIFETLNLLANAIVAARIYRGLMNHVKPSAVLLMPQRVLQSRVLSDIARSYGIATFDLPVGTMARSQIQWRTGCDYIFVADTGSIITQTQFFNLPEHRVRIIGAPRLDANTENLKALSVQPRPRYSLFLALQNLALEHNLKLITACATAAAQFGGHSDRRPAST